jgi:hypothetical protein
MKFHRVSLVSLLLSSWSPGATLVTGSPYATDLGTNDGNFSILWEGNTLLGAGSVTSYSYFARGTNPVRPLLVQQTGATYSVVGVGNPYTPSGTGMQNNVPFSLSTGTASFNTAGGSKYFFAFSPVGGNALQVGYNLNPEIGNQGHPLNYIGGELAVLGPVTWAGNLSGANARHYVMTVTSTLSGYLGSVGDELANRASVDAAGYGFIKTDESFSSTGSLMRWQIFSDDSSSHNITPVLYKAGTVAGTYDVVGVGASRTISSRGFMEFDFGLTTGSNAITSPGTFYAGWVDSNADGTGALGGVIPFNTFGGTVSFFGIPGGGPAAGSNIVPLGSDTRAYSVNFLTVPEPGTAALSLLAGLSFLRRRR